MNNKFFVMAIFAASAGIMLVQPAMELGGRFYYQTKPPVVVEWCRVDTPKIERGGTVQYTCKFDKRSGCDGIGYHFIEGAEPIDGPRPVRQKFTVETKHKNLWPNGKGVVKTLAWPIPHEIPEGKWLYKRTFSYSCKRTADGGPTLTPINIVYDPMAFEIVASKKKPKTATK